MDSARDVIDLLEQADRTVIVTHKKPDGDALGASLGLLRILRGRRRACTLAGLGPRPRRYAWMVRSGEEAAAAFSYRFEQPGDHVVEVP